MVAPWLASIGEFLVGGLVGGLKKKGSGLLASITSMLSMYAVHALYIEAPDVGATLAKAVTDTYYTPPREWKDFIASYISRMTGELIDYDDIAAAPAGKISTVASASLGKAFFDPMLNAMLPILKRTGEAAAIRPEDGLDSAHRFLSVNLQFQMSAWLLHLIGDWHSFGAFKSLKDLPNAISWSYGIGWLSWLVMGVPFRMGISDPLERYYNTRLRPTQLNFSQIMDLWHKDLLTPNEVSTKLDELGYGPELKWRLMAANWRTYTQADIRDLKGAGLITKEEAIEHMKYNDVSPAQAELKFILWDYEKTSKIIGTIVGKAEDMYVRGMMDAGTLRGYLKQGGYSATQQDLEITALELEKALKVSPDTTTRTLSPANIGALYRMGEYSHTQARDLLLRDNFEPEQVDDFLKLYAPTEVKPEEEKEASQSVLGRLFVLGEIPEGELVSNLTALGYSSTAIEYLLRDYRIKKEAKIEVVVPKVLTASQVGRLFKQEIITGEEAIERLRALAMTDEDIKYFLNLYLPPEEVTEEVVTRQLSQATIGRLFKEGEITYAEALDRLIGLNLTDTDAKLYLQLYLPEEVGA